MEDKGTKAFTCSVEYYDVTLPMIGDRYDTAGMDYVVFAKSYSEVEKLIKEEVGEHFIKIWGIEQMDAVPLGC